ncbi:MAG: hypothetical protein AAF975_01440 [Spirochaetota bacterium]
MFTVLFLAHLPQPMAARSPKDQWHKRPKWHISPSINMGYQAFSKGKGLAKLESGKTLTIVDFQYKSLKLGLGGAVAKQVHKVISVGVFSELRLLLGLANTGKYKLGRTPKMIEDGFLGFGMALGPYFHFKEK